MNEELIAQIEELGLSNKEARVYVANLILGPAGVQQIADTSGIKRVTTYVILESLIGLGLVSQTSKAKKTLFNAESPENLRRIIERKEQSLSDQKQQLTDLLPQLNSLKTLPKYAPSVKFYDGAEGIRTINKTFFANLANSSDKQTFGISNLDLLHEYFPHIEDEGANPERVKSGIKSKFIYTTSKGPIMKASDSVKNRQSRFVPIEKYPLTCDISIGGNTTVLLALTGSSPIGITIDSPEIAAGMKSVFNLTWEAAGQYN